MFKLRTAALLAVSVFVLGGCASFGMTKPAPTQTQPVTIDFAGPLSGGNDLPIGTYRVPDSQVIISGHQKGGGAGMLFGLVGVAIQHAANRAGGKNAVEEVEAALRINTIDQGKEVTRKLVASEPYSSKFKEGSAKSGPVLTVTSGVVLSFVNETDVKPFVVLKASLRDAKDKNTSKRPWLTRYIASSGAPRPLAGDNSWTANGGAPLRDAVSADLETAVALMLRDINSPLPRDETRLQAVEAQFPYVKPRLKTIGYLLGEDERSVYFVPKLGDIIVFAGVNVLPKDQISIRPTQKGDPAFAVVPDPAAEAAKKAKKTKPKKKSGTY